MRSAGSSCECRLLLLWGTGSRHMGFSSCHTWAQSSWRMGLATPWHVESSNPRGQTYVPFIGRWILIYLATREAPLSFPIVVIGLCFSLVKVGRFVSLSSQRARFLFFCCFSFSISFLCHRWSRAGLATCLPSFKLCGCEAQPTEDSERALGTVWEKGRQDLFAAVTFQRLTVK